MKAFWILVQAAAIGLLLLVGKSPCLTGQVCGAEILGNLLTLSRITPNILVSVLDVPWAKREQSLSHCLLSFPYRPWKYSCYEFFERMSICSCPRNAIAANGKLFVRKCRENK
jgi:hypothetical protein